jgi:uncharacterized repeat protein (TIGR03943 family)
MRRDTQGFVVLLAGAALLKVSLTGAAVRYVQASLVPLLVVTGVVLVALAGYTLWQEYGPAITGLAPRPARPAGRPAPAVVPTSAPPHAVPPASAPPAPEPSPEDVHAGYALHEGHDTEEFQLVAEPSALTAVTVALPVLTPTSSVAPLRMWDGDSLANPIVPGDGAGAEGQVVGRVGWLLLVAVLAMLVLAPPALGAFQATRYGTVVAIGGPVDTMADADPVRLGLVEFAARAAVEQGRSLVDRRVVLTGFLIDGPSGEPYLARMVIGCCAADARPVKVGLIGNLPADLEPDTWLEVEGTYARHAVRDPVNGVLIPYLQVTSANTIPAPPHPYEP